MNRGIGDVKRRNKRVAVSEVVLDAGGRGSPRGDGCRLRTRQRGHRQDPLKG